jgi:deazaflavin-dependent oxidoreductase (nitroreductase family)
MSAFQDEDPIAPRSSREAKEKLPEFRRPDATARIFNRMFGFLIGLGFGPLNSYLLETRGRTSGRVYSTPVYLLVFGGKEFLVAPRGRTQWVRNAEATGEISLKRGTARREYRMCAVPDAERPEILKAYLETFAWTVQRHFPVPKGSPATAFASIVAYYPVFELLHR